MFVNIYIAVLWCSSGILFIPGTRVPSERFVGTLQMAGPDKRSLFFNWNPLDFMVFLSSHMHRNFEEP